MKNPPLDQDVIKLCFGFKDKLPDPCYNDPACYYICQDGQEKIIAVATMTVRVVASIPSGIPVLNNNLSSLSTHCVRESMISMY